MSRIELDVGRIGKKKRSADSILDDLDVIDSSSEVMSISSFRPKKNSKKEDIQETAKPDDSDDWLETLASFKPEPIRASRARGGSGLFDYEDRDTRRKKKKGKKGKVDEGPDYSKEFEPEVKILQNILEDQLRFVNSLQRRYDTVESTKSAARGVGKFTTDLINAINQGRSASVQTANSVVSVKKTIADLKIKANKDKVEGIGEDMGSYSSQFLKKILNQSRQDLSAYGGEVVPVDGDPDDIFAGIEGSLSDEERPDEVEKYMKYGTDVDLAVCIDRETKDYEFVARNRVTGEIIPDYPTPTVSKLEINDSTNMASDEWYNKYPIIWKTA